jgi:proteasome lid subunit RPN8/RPN11
MRHMSRTARILGVREAPEVARYAGHVLTIDAAILDAIVAHARRDHPDEACGIVAGPIGSDEARRLIPMTNAARSMTYYEFDAQEYLRVWREMDDRDEEPVVIYHSHTATEAYPSRTDATIAGWPQAHYLLVSTRAPDVTEIRSFRIVDAAVTEEEVRVVNANVGSMAVQSYMFGQSPSAIDYECRA